MSIHYNQGNSTNDYANDGDVMKHYREGLEAEALLGELNVIYSSPFWRHNSSRVDRENEIKKRLSEIYGGNK